MYIRKTRLLTDINLEAKPKRCFRILVYYGENNEYLTSDFPRLNVYFLSGIAMIWPLVMSEYSPDIIASLNH